MPPKTHKPVTPTSKADTKAAMSVASKLRQWILDGELAPGQRLIEADLRQRLNTSRSTVREALLQLDGEGLVELVHQRGAFVTRLTEKDMADLFGVRERLEGYAAFLAAQKINEPGNREWLEKQREIWGHPEMLESERRHMAENILFHEGLLRMGDNDRLLTIVKRLQIPSYRQRFFDSFDLNKRKQSVEDHLNIINAVLAGDSKKAETNMRAHVRRAGNLAIRTAEGSELSALGESHEARKFID